MPGVSMSIAPPASGTSSRCVVVCRPRPSARRSPVAMTSRPASALTSVDLPAPDGPTTTSVAPGASSARSGSSPWPVRHADRVHVDRERHRRDLRGHAVGVGHEVGLRQDDDRRRPRAPRQREQPLDAAEVRVGLEVLDHEHDVDVGGERLHPGRGARGVADQGRGAGRAGWGRVVSSTSSQSPTVGSEPLAVLASRRRPSRSSVTRCGSCPPSSPSAGSTRTAPLSARTTRKRSVTPRR